MVTTVPTEALVGEKLEIVGVTRKFTLLVKVWGPGVVTLTLPVVAPLGTVVLIAVPVELTVNVAFVPLKVTLVEPVKLFPRIVTYAPTLPEVGSVSTNGPSPTERLKTVPQPWGALHVRSPPFTVVP